MREYKAEGKTVEDAVKKGLTALGLRRDQVEVKVESEGSSGFFGILAKKARVVLTQKKWTGAAAGNGNGNSKRRFAGKRGGKYSRYNRRKSRSPYADMDEQKKRPSYSGRYGYEDVRNDDSEEAQAEEPRQPRENARSQKNRPERVFNYEQIFSEYTGMKFPEDPLEQAKEVLVKLHELMGLGEASITKAEMGTSGAVSLEFDCKNAAVYTEDNGRLLQSVQFIVSTIVNFKRKEHVSVCIDTGHYWADKEEEIRHLIDSAVFSIGNNGGSFRLEPMPASMRKLVHNMVKESYPGFETSSEGEGRWRKVVIKKAGENQGDGTETQVQPEIPPAEADLPAETGENEECCPADKGCSCCCDKEEKTEQDGNE